MRIFTVALSLTLSCLFAPTAHATTIAPTIIESDTTWTLADSPYAITSDLTIPTGVTLTIEPGVVVKFDATMGMTVGGSLIARGTADTPILFTSLHDDTVGGDTNLNQGDTTPQAYDWEHIHILSQGMGDFLYTHIRYGGYEEVGIPTTGILNDGGEVIVRDSVLTDNGNDGFMQHAGTSTIIRTTLSRHIHGVVMTGGHLTIHDAVITDGYTGLNTFEDAPISGINIASTTFARNTFGIVTYHHHLSLRASRMIDQSTAGILNDSGLPLDMAHNWWGSASGPIHPSNPEGQGDRILGDALFAPWLTTDPLVVPPPSTCTTECYSNVLFLPGLEASRLFWTDPNCFFLNCENQLWLANNDADAEKLYLNANGASVLGGIYTSVERGAIDEVPLPVLGVNIYKTLLSDIRKWKDDDHLIADYAVTPYDWRLSVDDVLEKGIKNGDNIYYGSANGTYILDELLRMASSSRTQKVTIIAHSNGGLVAKQLMLKLRAIGKEDLVDKLILVAVPQVGTPKAVGGLLHGTSLGITGILDEEHARTMGENMPSAYALLPSQKYFETVNPNSVTSKLVSFTDSPLFAPERAQYGFLVSTMTELRGYLLGSDGRTEPVNSDLDSPNVLKSGLLDQASSTHALLDDWYPASTTEVVQIAGWGEETISGVSYYTEQKRDCVTVLGQFGTSHQKCGPYYEVKKYKPNFTIEGDGTVVVPSALWMSTTTPWVERYWVDLKRYNRFIPSVFATDHKNITEVTTLLDFIKNKLTNSTSSLPTYISNSPSTLSADPDTKYIYTLHSPLSLDLYDALGNHTGISTSTGYAEQNIPGSRYGTLGEVKYIIANADVTQRLELRGYATGTFSLDVEQIIGDTIIASTTFASVPVTPNTIATLFIPAESNLASSTQLVVDIDGNGTNDIVLSPQLGKVTYPDLSPPEAIFSFSPTTQDFTISGKDTEGTTSTRMSTTSATITDSSGNTLIIPFVKFKEKSTKLKIVFDTLVYNGIATTTPKVTLEYEWELKSNGILKSLIQDIRIEGVRRVTAEYVVNTNQTKIVDRVREDEEKNITKTTKPDIALLTLSSLGGVLQLTY